MPEVPLVAVVGPTGTGKSDLAVALALRLQGEVINADAMQFYRGMDIGTAKIRPPERRGVPHHLLDVLDISEEASVSAYQLEARRTIADIRSRGKTPILVGGSGLYVRAALDVLEFPGTDPNIRADIEAELALRGPEVLRERLRLVDPASADRLSDDRRLVRALEVHRLTGRPFSSFMPERRYVQPALQLGLDIARPALHERLAARVHRMVEEGLRNEVRELDARGLRQGRTASRALGYAQFLQVLDGLATIEQAAEATIIATRQFARRQATWFRADPRITWFDGRDPGLVERAAAAVASADTANL